MGRYNQDSGSNVRGAITFLEFPFSQPKLALLVLPGLYFQNAAVPDQFVYFASYLYQACCMWQRLFYGFRAEDVGYRPKFKVNLGRNI